MNDLSSLASTAQGLGIDWPSPAYIFGSLLFGLIGWAAFRFGRKREKPRTTWLGVTLMLYPYLVSRTWLLYLVGALLCVAVWFDRG